MGEQVFKMVYDRYKNYRSIPIHFFAFWASPKKAGKGKNNQNNTNHQFPAYVSGLRVTGTQRLHRAAGGQWREILVVGVGNSGSGTVKLGITT